MRESRNLYLPIPFEKHCRVTYDGPNLQETGKFEDCIYYNINYVKYPEGTEVQTFSKADLRAHAPLIARVQKTLLQPEEHALASDRSVPGGTETLQPGGSVVRQIQGAGAITALAVKLNADDIEQAMRSVEWTQTSRSIGTT